MCEELLTVVMLDMMIHLNIHSKLYIHTYTDIVLNNINLIENNT